MDSIYQNGIALIVALQTWAPWLSAPMRFFTFFGSQEFLLLILPIVYWSVNAEMGARIGTLLLINGGLNDVFKLAFHGPRPYWFSAQARALSFETSFGAPSGHAQVSVGIWGLVASTIKRPWAWAVAVGMLLLVGLSRIYLGVHFPHDVLLGWLMGTLVLWAFVRWADAVTRWIKTKSLGMQMAMAFGFSALMILASSVAFFLLQGWILPAAWIENSLKAGAPEAPNPLSLTNTVSSAGALFGFLAGLALTHFRGGFSAAGPLKLRGVRFIVGLIGLIILYYGLSKIFPGDGSVISYVFRYLRYVLIAGWITAGAPFVFLRLKLAQKN